MSGVTEEYRIDALSAEDGPACEKLTFPAYRHLLALAPALRHENEGDQRLVQPLGAVARVGTRVVALALAEFPVAAGPQAPELLSLYVVPDARGRGIGTALVEAIERTLAAQSATIVEAVYMTGRESLGAIERVFAKRGWEAPHLRTISVRFTPEEAMATPWYGRVGLPAGATMFPWADLKEVERQRLIASNEATPWIPNSLQPWRHDQIGFDEVSSVGMRYRGEVVGWVINHRIGEETVRFTCSFLRGDLSRRARILPLYSESIRRLGSSPCRFCTFVTPTVYPEMVEFIMRHCKPYVTFTGETRGTRKALAAAAAGVRP